jgi:copper transport protein
VRISFDEPITVDATDAVVVRSDRGVTIPCRPAAAVDPYDITSVICPLPRVLAKGRYTITWHVTSFDSHVARGVIFFGIGVPAGSPAEPPASPFDPSAPLATILRALMLYGTLIACGALAFEAIVGRRAGSRERIAKRCTRITAISASVALLACFPALLVQTIAVTGSNDAVLLEGVILATAWGHAWILHVIALATLVALSPVLADPIADRVAFVASLTAMLAFSISGHATGMAHDHPALGNVVADVVHLAGAGIWIGGLVAFLIASPFGDVRAVIVAFSPAASAAALAIALSGTYAAIVHVGAPEHYTDSPYGLIVVAKIVLFVALVALGARNLARGRALLGPSGFVRDTAIEATLAVAAVALSAMLTGLPPPHAHAVP